MFEPTQVVLAALDLTYSLVGGFIVLLILVFVVVLNNFRSISEQRCPRCKRYFGLNETGSERGPGEQSNIVYAEYRCDYCGNLTWREETPQ